jgi:hypothetical protein
VDLIDELHAVCAALDDASIAYAICGGIAVTIHGATRTTKDIDLLVEPADVPRILERLAPLGYSVLALPMTFDPGTQRERHVHRVSKLDGAEHLAVDLVLADAALTGMLADRVEIDLPAGRLSVVSRAALVKMKRLSGRAQDLADLEKLGDVDAT